MNLSTIQENTTGYLAEVEALSLEIGHPVELLAATKTRNKEEIQSVIQAGVRFVGENKADELCRKYEEQAYTGASLHFIGTLQSNKAKYLVGKADLIHSLCTESAAEAIERVAARKGLIQEVLVEIHSGTEETKSGIAPEKIDSFLTYLAAFPHIRVRGLMTVAPVGEAPMPYFQAARALFDSLKEAHSLDILSMGMTADYREAILAGATMVRIGSGLFGPRDYTPSR